MDLLNEKREQPVEKSKGKKIVLILLILSIIGAIGIGILISFLKANKVIPNTLYINGEKKEISNTLFVSDKNGNKYMNLKELAELLGYKFDNSEYQKYDLDTTKCYIANGKLISGFEMDSNKIYKYEEGTNLDYQHYTLNHNILPFYYYHLVLLHILILVIFYHKILLNNLLYIN